MFRAVYVAAVYDYNANKWSFTLFIGLAMVIDCIKVLQDSRAISRWLWKGYALAFGKYSLKFWCSYR